MAFAQCFSTPDVSRVAEKKTSAYDFPDADGTLIQDLGRKGRRYPLRLMFGGPDHDLEADAFEQTLLERGAGILEHPRYGQVDVVPFGEITQRDDLVRSANQTVIDVVFWETIGTAYPAATANGQAVAAATVAAYATAAAEQAAQDLSVVTPVESVTLSDQWESLIGDVDAALSEVTQAQANVQRQVDAVRDSISNGLSVLIGQPLTLAAQTLVLIQAPAKALNQIEQQLNGYRDLAARITGGGPNRIGTGSVTPLRILQPTNDNRAANELAARQLFAQGAVSAATLAALDADYQTQPQAISAAESILDQFDRVVAWSDANLTSA